MRRPLTHSRTHTHTHCHTTSHTCSQSHAHLCTAAHTAPVHARILTLTCTWAPILCPTRPRAATPPRAHTRFSIPACVCLLAVCCIRFPVERGACRACQPPHRESQGPPCTSAWPRGRGWHPAALAGGGGRRRGASLSQAWMEKKCVQGGGSCSGSLGANLGIPRLATASPSLATGPLWMACAACIDIAGGSRGRQGLPIPASCRGPAPAQDSLSLPAICGPRAAPAREAAALPVRSYLWRFMNDSQASAVCL